MFSHVLVLSEENVQESFISLISVLPMSPSSHEPVVESISSHIWPAVGSIASFLEPWLSITLFNLVHH